MLPTWRRIMAITAILTEQLDNRREGDDCSFNGFLEDYLGVSQNLDPVILEAFRAILEEDPDVRICAGLRSEISRDAISNQIIRYKDVFKLSGKAMVYPYILYETKEGQDRALLVVPYSTYSFIYAKGYYYCMTEPGSRFIDCKNEIVAVSSDKPQEIQSAWSRIFRMKAGALQRSIDHEHFHDYEELRKDALEASAKQKEEAAQVLPTLEDRTETIRQYVIHWFLLKKVLYVQYMVNKSILNTVHEGNVKKQRNQAKLNADEISFLSYSEMWRMQAPAEESSKEE